MNSYNNGSNSTNGSNTTNGSISSNTTGIPTPVPDHGPNPFVVDLEKAAIYNNTYRTALWTGPHLQLTVMSIEIGDDIGLEVHPNVDQFLYIVGGRGLHKWGIAEITST